MKNSKSLRRDHLRPMDRNKVEQGRGSVKKQFLIGGLAQLEFLFNSANFLRRG